MFAGECPLDPGGYFIVRGTEKVSCWTELATCMLNMSYMTEYQLYQPHA